jgi:hypothetical protein
MAAKTTTYANGRKKPAPKPKHVAINVALPVALHRKLRVKAINDDLTLPQAVAAAITAWAK